MPPKINRPQAPMNTKKALDHTEVFDSVLSSHFVFVGVKTKQNKEAEPLVFMSYSQQSFVSLKLENMGQHIMNSMRENKQFLQTGLL